MLSTVEFVNQLCIHQLILFYHPFMLSMVLYCEGDHTFVLLSTPLFCCHHRCHSVTIFVLQPVTVCQLHISFPHTKQATALLHNHANCIIQESGDPTSEWGLFLEQCEFDFDCAPNLCFQDLRLTTPPLNWCNEGVTENWFLQGGN